MFNPSPDAKSDPQAFRSGVRGVQRLVRHLEKKEWAAFQAAAPQCLKPGDYAEKVWATLVTETLIRTPRAPWKACMEALAQAVGSVNAPEKNLSPLMRLCHLGHVPAAQWLIEQGAEVSAVDWQGQSVFQFAAPHVGVVRLLLGQGGYPLDRLYTHEDGAHLLHDGTGGVLRTVFERGLSLSQWLRNPRLAYGDRPPTQEHIEVLYQWGLPYEAIDSVIGTNLMWRPQHLATAQQHWSQCQAAHEAQQLHQALSEAPVRTRPRM